MNDAVHVHTQDEPEHTHTPVALCASTRCCTSFSIPCIYLQHIVTSLSLPFNWNKFTLASQSEQVQACCALPSKCAYGQTNYFHRSRQLRQNLHAYKCQLTMKGHDIHLVPFLLTHLCCICKLSMCCLLRTLLLSSPSENIASPTVFLQIQHFLPHEFCHT